MAGKVRVEFDVALQKAIQEFDKMTKAQQKLLIAGSKVGKEFEKTEKKITKSGKAGVNAFDGLKSKIRASVDVVSILSKGLQLVNREYENQIRLQKKAAGTQQTFEAATGNFIANNQQALQRSPKLLRQVRQFSLTQGARLGEGGAAEVLQGITDVRSKSGEGFTLEQQLSAVQKAVEGKLLDPAAQLGSIATANLRVQKALGVTEREAQNTLISFGPTAGGDINAFVGEFGKLAGLSGATREVEKRQFGAPKTKLSDILALEGITSQALGLSPEETTTIVQSVISKVGGARVGKKQLDFKSENAVDRILELSDRVLSGEFGTGAERQQVLTSAGLKGSQALPFLGSLAKSRGQLASARESIFEATTTGKDFQAESLGLLSPTARGIQAVQKARGATDVSQITDTAAGTRARIIEEVQTQRDREKLGLLGDPTSIIRDALVTAGILGRETAVGLQQRAGEEAISAGGFTVSPELATAGIRPAAGPLGPLVVTLAKLADALTDKNNTTPAELGGQ